MFDESRLNRTAISVIIVLGAAIHGTLANSPVPPFVAKGTIIIEDFQPGQSAPYYTIEADLSFYSSNKWWQVDIRPKNPSKDELALQSCMRISDGIRTFSLFADDTREGLTPTDVCPISHPLPGNWMSLYTWLSLCPDAELPINASGEIRRFVNIPFCVPKLFSHPDAAGNLSVRYLQPQKAFLEELSIDNSGISIGLGVDQKPEFVSFHHPFDKGFTEFTFELVESTNLNGLKFPLKTTIKRFMPNWHPEAKDSLFASSVSHLNVHEIYLTGGAQQERASGPQRVVAIDSRPGDLPNGRTVDYIVTNDLYSPLSDPKIQSLAKILRLSERPSDNGLVRGIFVAILVALSSIAFYVFFVRKS